MAGRRCAVAIAALAVAAMGAGSWLAVSQGPGPAAAPRGRPVVRPAAPAGATGKDGPAATAGTSQVAIVLADSPRYDRPGHRVAGTVTSQWEHRPAILPVIATRPGWVQVRLPQRPNGSTSWLPSYDVNLTGTAYRIVVNVAARRLALYDRGRLVLSAPAGIGTASDPTPPGHYFVAFDEQPPRPGSGYGPFIMVTSAHSPDIADWEGSGDAIIGIHGPLGADAAIGTTGAMISHGCIRLHLAALRKLRDVPPGTPVDIVSVPVTGAPGQPAPVGR
jgi:lipoprotein-anchoring transpeptidase ErfK/SrfK